MAKNDLDSLSIEELAALRENALRMPLEGSIDLLSKLPPREHWLEIVRGFEGPLAYVVTPKFREQARHLLADRPQSRIEVFEDAGHALFVDDAARFNRLLTDSPMSPATGLKEA